MTLTSAPHLSETHVGVAGDWHGNIVWIQRAIPAFHRVFPDVKTLLHLGDFGLYRDRGGKGFRNAVDYWCKRTGIERVLVTPGNHEDWDWLEQLFAVHPGEPVQVSEVIWVMPRAYRFELGGASLMSFGGAGSVDVLEYLGPRALRHFARYPNDRAARVTDSLFMLAPTAAGPAEMVFAAPDNEAASSFRDLMPAKHPDWWPGEMPSSADVAAAVSGGAVDVLLTHETVSGGTLRTESLMMANPNNWPAASLRYAGMSRARVTEVYETLRPRLLMHGHMHVFDRLRTQDGEVISFGKDGQRGNLAVLNPESLRVQMFD